MRRLMPAAVVLLVVVAILPAIADKAKTALRKRPGRRGAPELRSRLRLYKQAYDLKPKDLRYRASFERMRFKAASDHRPSRGRCCGTQGKLQEALADISKGGADRSFAFHRATGD